MPLETLHPGRGKGGPGLEFLTGPRLDDLDVDVDDEAETVHSGKTHAIVS